MKVYAKDTPEITESEKRHGEIARKMAGECIVLLENDGTLPLARDKDIALFGSGARHTVKGGTGSGEVNSRYSITIEQGFLDAGYRVVSDAWLDRQEKIVEKSKRDHQEKINRVVAETGDSYVTAGFNNPYHEPEPELITADDLTAAKAEIAVYVVSRNSGEGKDRENYPGDYRLSENEKKNLEILSARYEKTVLILNIGGVMDLSEVKNIPGIHAVVLMTQLGNIGGAALLDVLSGKVTPSGKLTDTWAFSYADYPSSATFSQNNGDVDDDDYTEGIYVGYRYFDTAKKPPLYPFGYGLSYTTFSLHTEKVSIAGDRVDASVCVKNTGTTYSGKEVVQVYVSAPDGDLAKSYQGLKGYAKTSLLAPGESETLTITFLVRALANYSEKKAAWILERGDYIVRVGSSSNRTEAAATLRLPSEVVVEQEQNVFAKDRDFAELIIRREIENPSPEPVLLIDPEAIETKISVYPTREEMKTEKTGTLTLEDVRTGACSVEELVAQLSVAEMADFCVGTLRADEGDVIGNASNTVPGAAGDTSSICAEDRKIPSLIMADGPAGLRLQPHFKTTKDGELIPGGEMFGDSVAPFPEDLDPEQTIDYYQYCTAIPIGWALAQSWNLPLIEETADMVGEEMEQFHIHLWLAPALNIHRNPLCGRNFEYYSEDPFVSGKMAAAITRGAQRHPSCGVTIKHFACNNQEENRYFTNVHIGERAMREIYLKGFEIAIRESDPAAIMTSYNLINGLHAANSVDLLEKVCRNEWGFAGVIMTDWFSSQEVPFTNEHKPQYPIAASTGCVVAGNDIQMPGSKKNMTDLIASVEEGKEIDGFRVTLADLQFCTANVLRTVLRLTNGAEEG